MIQKYISAYISALANPKYVDTVRTDWLVSFDFNSDPIELHERKFIMIGNFSGSF
jgi:hypothetical protein